MATYKQIQQFVKINSGFVPKTCWIAHMKELCGLPVETAANRIDEDRQVPCPLDKQDAIRSAFQHFGMNAGDKCVGTHAKIYG